MSVHALARGRSLVVLALLALAWVIPDALAAQPAPVSIVAIGDSITQGDATHQSYRYPLWASLLDAGLDFDLVGTLDTNAGGNPPFPDHGGVPFDRDHEGRAGWRTDEVLGVLPAAMAGYTPDIALVHLGTNDILQGQPNSTTVAEIAQVVDVLRADNPSVTVLVAQLIPIAFGGYAERVPELNEMIAAMAAEKTTAASPVIVVDQFTGFTANLDTYDGLHPNSTGEQKMAQRWREVILGLPGSPVVTGFAPAPGATQVAAGAAVSVTFDRSMAPGSIHTATFTVSREGGALVAGQVAYDDATRTASFVPDQPLAPGAVFQAAIYGGAAGVTSAEGVPLPGSYTWTFTTDQALGDAWQYLGDLQPIYASNGWGPYERNANNGEQAAEDGGPLSLNGVTYSRGIGSHAPAEIRFGLDAACQRFVADVGLDDAMNGTGGSVQFEVWADGALLYNSGVMWDSSPTQAVDLPMDGVQVLALVVRDGGNNNWWDWADWADARVECHGAPAPEPDTTPPTVTAVTPADGASGVPVQATPTVQFDEAMDPGTITAANVQLTLADGSPVAHGVAYAAATRTATVSPAQALSPDTAYRVTVSGVTDVAGNALAAPVTWVFATGPAEVVYYLSDLAWTSATNGWGPVERDTNVGEQPAGDGTPIRLGGVTYPRGLGTHANAEVRYALGAACSRFQAQVGLDDAMDGTGGSVRFEVWADGVQLFDSGVMWHNTATKTIDVAVQGAQELVLVARDGGDRVWWDWASWGDAKVTCTSPPAP